jgi:hypothetical protein
MATTTNYGWTTPDDTALVKDGASAIRTLGSSIDTTTKNLNPSTTLGDIEYRSSTANVNTRLPLGTAGQVLKVNSGATAPEWSSDNAGMTNPMTTTGDTIYSSSGSTPARLAIGSTGNVLTVAGGVPTWAAPAGGGSSWSLLNTGGTALTGASTITVSGISGVDKIQVIVEGASAVNASVEMKIRFNSNTSSVYRSGVGLVKATSTASDIVQNSGGLDNAFLLGTTGTTRADNNVYGGVSITGANSSGFKAYSAVGAGGSYGGNPNQIQATTQGMFESTATISSVSIISGNGNFDAGTIYVYTSVS